MMRYYLAPLEGVTTYIYRNAYHTIFHPADKYFTPFLVPHQKKDFNTREWNEIAPEHNQGMNVVPQILTNQSADFIKTAKGLMKLGYQEVNLNLGCPSRTVVSKNRGSGFLALQEELNQFLYEIFEALDLKISIKTRIGRTQSEEFYDLIQIFNKYQMEELIIHPRIQTDYYKNKPNLDVFKDAWKLSKNPICYNGDIFTPDDAAKLSDICSGIDKLMLGRGVIANPGLIGQLCMEAEISKEQVRKFHEVIYTEYRAISQGEKNALFKMKELWSYLIHLFTNYEKYAKRIKKSQRCKEYENVIIDLFQEQEFVCSHTR